MRRPIDDFFLSLAVDQQANAACVILSGTGADGTTGLRAVKEHGGVCVVQQPDSARYDGMPLSAVGTGLVDFVQPPGRSSTASPPSSGAATAPMGASRPTSSPTTLTTSAG
ncbi:chemotaxis protein CheB [Methylobacterium persicinum]